MPEKSGSISEPEKPKYVCLEYKGADSEILYREADGIIVGQRSAPGDLGHCVVIFGAEPNRKSSRVFISREHASNWIRNILPAIDIGTDPAEFSIEVRDAEGSVILPHGSLKLPGSMTRMN